MITPTGLLQNHCVLGTTPVADIIKSHPTTFPLVSFTYTGQVDGESIHTYSTWYLCATISITIYLHRKYMILVDFLISLHRVLTHIPFDSYIQHEPYDYYPSIFIYDTLTCVVSIVNTLFPFMCSPSHQSGPSALPMDSVPYFLVSYSPSKCIMNHTAVTDI